MGRYRYKTAGSDKWTAVSHVYSVKAEGMYVVFIDQFGKLICMVHCDLATMVEPVPQDS